jgi:hypothetical protein
VVFTVSTAVILNHVFRHDPQPVSSTSNDHNQYSVKPAFKQNRNVKIVRPFAELMFSSACNCPLCMISLTIRSVNPVHLSCNSPLCMISLSIHSVNPVHLPCNPSLCTQITFLPPPNFPPYTQFCTFSLSLASTQLLHTLHVSLFVSVLFLNCSNHNFFNSIPVSPANTTTVTP